MHSVQEVLWGMGIALEMAILFRLVSEKAWRWKSLMAYCAWDLPADAVLVAARHDYSVKFYAYWTWFAVSALIRLWILWDVLASLPGAKFLLPQLRRFVFALGVALSVGSYWFTSLDTPAPRHMSAAALALSSAVYLVWASFALALLVGVAVFRLFWGRCGALVASGSALKATLCLLVAYLLPSTAGDVLLNLSSLACLVLWLAATQTEDLVCSLNLSFHTLRREG